jgi:hypothetical protein
MRRFMIHLQNPGKSPADATEVLHHARSYVEDKGVIVRDARISSKYIEYDISVPNEVSEKSIVEKLESIAHLASIEQVEERHLPKDQAISMAVRYFNDEKYWSAHELLEGVWKSTSGTEKSVLNGIILVAAAFVHHQKNEHEICISILERALKKLDTPEQVYHGIELARLVGIVKNIVKSHKIHKFTI